MTTAHIVYLLAFGIVVVALLFLDPIKNYIDS